MADETRWLTASLLGSEPKAWGFASLLTFAQARALARTCTSCPLDHQDTALWDRALIAEGQLLLPRRHTRSAARAVPTRSRDSAQGGPISVAGDSGSTPG